MSPKLLRIAGLLAICLLAGSAANAQLRNPRQQVGEGEILIQAQRSMTLRPGPGAEIEKLQDEAVRMIYRMAERECALILETIGASCELASVNTSISTGDESVSNPFIRSSGSFSMRVKLKS